MRNLLKFALATSSAIILIAQAHASDPKTFVGPTLQGSYTSWLTNYSGYTLLGEAGAKNFRINATYGWKIQNNERLKFSAEYLWQKIKYDFFSGDSSQWENQGAVGFDYQYDFGTPWMWTADLSAYFSHAPSKNLSTVTGTFVENGFIIGYIENRRIAGSNAGGFSPGLSFMPWGGANLGVNLNYDNVRYNTRFPHGHNATGLGGTAHLTQMISDALNLDLSAAVRAPFNNYQAELNWIASNSNGRLIVGIFGAYTAGKDRLPTTYNAGLSLSYLADCMVNQPLNLKGDVKGEATTRVPYDPAFLSWMHDPAVNMPQVLAVTDAERTCTCELTDLKI